MILFYQLIKLRANINLPRVFCLYILTAMDEEKIFANALNQDLHIGAASLKKIKQYFGSFKNGWKAGFSELKNATGSRELTEFRKNIDPEKEFKELENDKIKILFPEKFPALLKEIADPPQILYIKGRLPNTDPPDNEAGKTHLAVVGTRKFSSYGKEVCEKLINELRNYDVVIVSGLALGIDAIAHKSAIANQMRTIGVLGSGLHENVLYPRANLRLANEIIEKSGCLISEYAYRAKAAQFTFPQRNRIAAGLSEGTLIIEAPERSGAMITAFLALEYNREVFSVPGGIFNINSGGTNNLLKMGALPVTNVDDILHALGIEPGSIKEKIKLSPVEEKIIALLYEPLERDELIRKTNLSPKEINPLLSQMEIKGIIKEITGKIYPAERGK
ncbi:DNA-processing protein DprA [Patescibacteria group bacterium]